MATTSRNGENIHTSGELPPIGAGLPQFTLTANDLTDISSRDFSGKRIVLNIFPSVDTSTCSMSVRHFNELAATWPNTVVICVSRDLPFALSRFCGAEGIENVVTASAFRSTFGADFGVTMTDGAMRGLFARCVVIADEKGTVIYTRVSPVLGEEPDYAEAEEAVLGQKS